MTPILEDVRSIPESSPEDGKLALSSGSPRGCKDVRRHERVVEGPIANETEFNNFLLSTNGRKSASSAVRILRSFLQSDHKIVMTHAYLHSRNIIVTVVQEQDVQSPSPEATEAMKSPQVNIVGLTDWEMSGWYPEY